MIIDKKMSKVQQYVIDLMKSGWELGHWSGWHDRYVLQKEGLGKGGETKNVSGATVHALMDKGYIKIVREERTTRRYALITKIDGKAELVNV